MEAYLLVHIKSSNVMQGAYMYVFDIWYLTAQQVEIKCLLAFVGFIVDILFFAVHGSLLEATPVLPCLYCVIMII